MIWVALVAGLAALCGALAGGGVVLAYARWSRRRAEPPRAVDLAALLDLTAGQTAKSMELASAVANLAALSQEGQRSVDALSGIVIYHRALAEWVATRIVAPLAGEAPASVPEPASTLPRPGLSRDRTSPSPRANAGGDDAFRGLAAPPRSGTVPGSGDSGAWQLGAVAPAPPARAVSRTLPSFRAPPPPRPGSAPAPAERSNVTVLRLEERPRGRDARREEP